MRNFRETLQLFGSSSPSCHVAPTPRKSKNGGDGTASEGSVIRTLPVFSAKETWGNVVLVVVDADEELDDRQ